MNATQPNRRTIAVVSVAPLWPQHFAADLEIAAEHLDRGDDVHLLLCSGGLQSCTARPVKDPAACIRCRAVQRAGIRALGIPKANVHRVPTAAPAVPLHVETLDELREFRPDSQAGRAAASSLVSFLRDPDPDLRRHAHLAASMLSSAEAVHRWTSAVLSEIDADQVVIFNGRFVNAMPALSAARQLGVPTVAHERNWSDNGFITRHTGSVHNLGEMGDLLVRRDAELAASPADRSHALQWFEGRRFPISEPIQTFTANQTEGLLPEGFDPGRTNVAIFVSSDDEFVAFSEWGHRFHATQEDTIRALATHTDLSPTVDLWVRVHPNLRGLENSQTARLAELTQDGPHNLRVIPADSIVDTYALIEASDLVVTFGSTVGAEAVYWGTPVVLLGRAAYERMRSVTIPETLTDAVDLISAGLSTPAREDALAFGALMSETGHRFTHYQPAGPRRPARFNGHSLFPSIPVRLHVKLRRLWSLTMGRIRR